MRKPPPHERRTHQIPVDFLIVDEGPRPIDPSRVEVLVKSMGTFGMHSPIVVEGPCNGPDGFVSPDPSKSFFRVIAGRHRVAAAKQLGWETVEALDFANNIYFDRLLEQTVDENGEYHEPDFDIAARMWAIAENLHRAELSALQRSEQIAEWIELERKWREGVDKLAQLAPVSGGRGNTGGINAASRDLGVDRTEAQRSVKIASLTEEAKAAAVDAGLDDNKSALLAAAKAAPQKQATIIRDYAEKKRSGIDRDVKERAAKEVAAMLAEHIPGEWWDALKANLYAAGAANIAHELTNITGQSIMDRRYSAA